MRAERTGRKTYLSQACGSPSLTRLFFGIQYLATVHLRHRFGSCCQQQRFFSDSVRSNDCIVQTTIAVILAMSGRLSVLSQPLRGALRFTRLPSQSILSARPSATIRHLHTTRPLRAKYERFGGGRGPTGPSGRPDLMMFLRRRFGSDRAIWLYGIGIGGGGLYYVTQ